MGLFDREKTNLKILGITNSMMDEQGFLYITIIENLDIGDKSIRKIYYHLKEMILKNKDYYNKLGLEECKKELINFIKEMVETEEIKTMLNNSPLSFEAQKELKKRGINPLDIKYCVECGNPLENNAKFCTNCGAETLFDDNSFNGGHVSRKNKRINAKKRKALENKPKDALFFMDGRQASLSVFEEFVQFDSSTSNTKKWLSHLGGVKRVYYTSINSIQKRDPSSNWTGMLEFEVPGSNISKNKKAAKENTINYDIYWKKEADEIYEYVNNKLLEINKIKINPSSGAPTEKISLSQLKEAKELLDLEIISQEEFDEIKRKILDNI